MVGFDCPRCGESEEIWPVYHPGTGWRVICDECDWRGPYSWDEEMAISAAAAAATPESGTMERDMTTESSASLVARLREVQCSVSVSENEFGIPCTVEDYDLAQQAADRIVELQDDLAESREIEVALTESRKEAFKEAAQRVRQWLVNDTAIGDRRISEISDSIIALSEKEPSQ